MRGASYCYFHARDRRRQPRQMSEGDVRLEIPSLQTRGDIVAALDQIMNALANGDIAPRRASTMLYAVQMAQQELNKNPASPFNLAELLSAMSGSQLDHRTAASSREGLPPRPTEN